MTDRDEAIRQERTGVTTAALRHDSLTGANPYPATNEAVRAVRNK